MGAQLFRLSTIAVALCKKDLNMIRFITVILAIGGSLARSQPDSVRLAAAATVIPQIETEFNQQRPSPEYVVYSDSFTARVLEPWIKPPALRSASNNSTVVCPWSKSEGVHGYTIAVHVDSLSNRRATVRYQIRCDRSFHGGFGAGELVRVERHDGRWSIAKILDRWIT